MALEVIVGAETVAFNLERFRDALEGAIETFGPSWVVIDPLVATHSADENKATAVRKIMVYLCHIARQYSLAVSVVQHPNKMHNAPDLYRIRGSLDFVAAARAVFLVTKANDQGVKLSSLRS